MKKVLVVIVAVLFALGVVGMSVAATKKSGMEENPADVKTQKAAGNGDKAKTQKKDLQKDAKPGQLKDKPGLQKEKAPGQTKIKDTKAGQTKVKDSKAGQYKEKAPASDQKANTGR